MADPTRADFYVWRGDTLRVTFTINNTAGTAPQDLTGWSFRVRGVNEATGAEVFDQTPVPATPASGQIQIYFSAAETLAFPPGQLTRYQVQSTDPDGNETTEIEGWMTGRGDLPA